MGIISAHVNQVSVSSYAIQQNHHIFRSCLSLVLSLTWNGLPILLHTAVITNNIKIYFTLDAKGILHGRLSDNFDGLPLVILDSAECKARPVAIEVPQPVRQDALYFPFFVTLHRCGGACNGRPFETKCEVQGKHVSL